MSVEPLGRRNEPSGDVDSRPFWRGDEIIGEEVGVENNGDVGVWGKGDAGGENDDDEGEHDVGKPSISSVVVDVGERSSTDGLLLGMGDSQVSLRDSRGGRTPSWGSWVDK